MIENKKEETKVIKEKDIEVISENNANRKFQMENDLSNGEKKTITGQAKVLEKSVCNQVTDFMDSEQGDQLCQLFHLSSKNGLKTQQVNTKQVYSFGI